MAIEEQLSILKLGVPAWNQWRSRYYNVVVDLREAKLKGMNLDGIDLHEAYLTYANLEGTTFKNAKLKRARFDAANLSNTDFSNADLTWADLQGSVLNEANLQGAYLIEAYLGTTILKKACLDEANLNGADLGTTDFEEASLYKAQMIECNLRNARLNRANLSEAILMGADLRNAFLIQANLRKTSLYMARLNDADLTDADLTEASLINTSFLHTKVHNAKISKSRVYGVNVWDLEGEFQEQLELLITPSGEPSITVDNIKVAQFVYLLLNNKEIRDVINTLTSKTVLILGRFTDEKRKAILNALRSKLREYNLLPIVFDFDRPIDRNITETIKTLAGISYFVIADITSPKSSPLELQAIIPDFQIPVIPIIQEGEFPFSMINDLRSQYNGLLDPLTYDSEEALIKVLKSAIIDPAIEKHNELRLIKAQKPKIRSAKDFLDKEME